MDYYFLDHLVIFSRKKHQKNEPSLRKENLNEILLLRTRWSSWWWSKNSRKKGIKKGEKRSSDASCYTLHHSSEIRSLCLMKWSSKTLQNSLYFWNTKIHVVVFLGFHFVLNHFFPNECPGLCRHKSGHSLEKKIK